MKPTDFNWYADGVVEKFKALYAERLTHSQIAAKMGISRSASIGKAHRLGLETRKGEFKGLAKGTQPRKRKINPRPSVSHPGAFVLRGQKCGGGFRVFESPTLAVAEAPAECPETAVGLLDLHEHHCRWPYGEGREMLFCGTDALDKLPYCAGHCRIAYRQPVRRAA